MGNWGEFRRKRNEITRSGDGILSGELKDFEFRIEEF